MFIDSLQSLDTIEFKNTNFYFREDNIVIIRIKDNSHIELADTIKERQYLLREKSHLLPIKVMIISGSKVKISKEAKDYANSPESTCMIKAEALVVRTFAEKMAANFISKIYNVPMPIKAFTAETDALKWLMQRE
ncbi:hypothetical protein K6119_06330 [Paracrocinitomix mangrovi]|uniref:DUF7793 family protein n=1 Tax=Paracrocinitomix mangrovi TaxID=2862509 RepID=UPI001C8D4669|nr:hypothetical protein [Paracrocinitomix mangrovi]UKN03129.1 hypothetical protein K6119_06330 [Paracrocinitomix mangrovi]